MVSILVSVKWYVARLTYKPVRKLVSELTDFKALSDVKSCLSSLLALRRYST